MKVGMTWLGAAEISELPSAVICPESDATNLLNKSTWLRTVLTDKVNNIDVFQDSRKSRRNLMSMCEPCWVYALLKTPHEM